jgi:hypothetical protein
MSSNRLLGHQFDVRREHGQKNHLETILSGESALLHIGNSIGDYHGASQVADFPELPLFLLMLLILKL